MLMKTKSLFLLIMLIMVSCQNGLSELDEPTMEVNNDTNTQIAELRKDLELVHANFQNYIDSTASTRGLRDFLMRSIVIAGADAASMIAAGSGIGAMINVGLITPPGAASFVTALVVCGAAGSISAALMTGAINLKRMDQSQYREITLSFAGGGIPEWKSYQDPMTIHNKPIYMDTRMLVPRGYEELATIGCLHNRILLSYVHGWHLPTPAPYYIDTWKSNFTYEPFERCDEPNFYIYRTVARVQAPKACFTNIVLELKKRKFISEEVSLVLDSFYKSLLLCKNANDLDKLANDYVMLLWSKKGTFTEGDFQAMLAGFSVARESVIFWESIGV